MMIVTTTQRWHRWLLVVVCGVVPLCNSTTDVCGVCLVHRSDEIYLRFQFIQRGGGCDGGVTGHEPHRCVGCA